MGLTSCTSAGPAPVWENQVLEDLSFITKYGSTLYIGMDEVLAHYACTFEILDLHFHFQ